MRVKMIIVEIILKDRGRINTASHLQVKKQLEFKCKSAFQSAQQEGVM